jgi:hypothetical protein
MGHMFERNISPGVRMNELQQALALLDRFERGEFVQPSEAERLLVQIFEACCYPVAEKGFVGSANSLLEVDCFTLDN